MMKAHATLSPLAIQGSHIFGYKNNLRGPANKLVLFRLCIWSNEVEHRSSIGRGHTHSAQAGLKDHIRNHREPNLIHVKLQALLQVTNENVNRLNAKVRLVSLQGKRWLV